MADALSVKVDVDLSKLGSPADDAMQQVQEIKERTTVTLWTLARQNVHSALDNYGVATGRLEESIQMEPNAGVMQGLVFSNLVYAAIHEFGGTILPIKGKYLTFKTAAGNWVRTTRVVMPARPYMGPAVNAVIPLVEGWIRAIGATP